MSLAAFTFTDRVRPIIEIGIGDARGITAGVWQTSRWSTSPAFWGGTEPTWIDVSCDVRRVEAVYGRIEIIDRFAVGAMRVEVDNSSGWADPNAAVIPGALTVRPGRQLRVSIDHATLGRKVLFRGWIDAMTPTYHHTDDDTVVLTSVDALGEVNRAKLKPLAAPAFDGEAADSRISRILDAAQWGTPRDLQPSAETVLATDLGGQVADLLSLTADSAAGAVFGDLAGRIAFRPRDWQAYQPGSPVDGTIGNVDPTDVCPVEWQRPFDRADIATRAMIGRDAASAVVVDDAAGIALYGIEPFERTDLITKKDGSLTLFANRVLSTRGSGTAPRVRSVTLDASTSNAAADLMTTVDVYKPSRYRCRLAYPRGTVFDGQYFATGVTHTLTPSAWTLALNLDVAAPFAIGTGRWDSAAWDKANWAASAVALVAEARDLLEEMSA